MAKEAWMLRLRFTRRSFETLPEPLKALNRPTSPAISATRERMAGVIVKGGEEGTVIRSLVFFGC
jgi:hypothetical protein